jgi:hypothetical protein
MNGDAGKSESLTGFASGLPLDRLNVNYESVRMAAVYITEIKAGRWSFQRGQHGGLARKGRTIRGDPNAGLPSLANSLSNE